MIIVAYKIPQGLRNILMAMYSRVIAMAAGPGRQQLFHVESGVLQGCPLSGSLFALCVDPLYKMLRARLLQDAIPCAAVTACADDVGIALADVRLADRAAEVFVAAERCARLRLKPRKCKLIPLAETDPDPAVWAGIIACVVPAWRDFHVVAYAKYLG